MNDVNLVGMENKFCMPLNMLFEQKRFKFKLAFVVYLQFSLSQ